MQTLECSHSVSLHFITAGETEFFIAQISQLTKHYKCPTITSCRSFFESVNLNQLTKGLAYDCRNYA